MNGTNIALTIISVLGTLSSILFAYLAFSRNKKNDDRVSTIKETQKEVDMATIKIDLKYMRDGVDRIEKRLDDYERIQGKMLDRLTRLEEHQTRVDGRLDKHEQKKTKKGDCYI